ncbi:DegT/DnrJ/EryC1/StrS family aminotransferase [Agaribacterium haliotis]|uniref:DegT/DnrJ/EryC1/StrS family aminotransferase n=1 Tax=Agaribacterium haliotis TaxID=2013869 RepID=UPI000BB55222|nr:DegT/DnrJ/EryC1/StrS family aminotransferase [Agaribacterium haliotis]
MRLPLATATWDECEYQAIQDVVESGMFSMGPKVKAFEEAFAKYVGSKFCVMVNSGSSANLLAIAALRYRKQGMALHPGDEVIVPAVSWSTTYSPLYQYGLKIKFVDVDPNTLNICLDALEQAITDDTKAIMSVNLLGNPVDYTRVKHLAHQKSILLIEDNCESLGASLDGKQAGTFGVLGTFSSFFSHHISTMEGGMVVTDDEELYHIMLSLRSHGWTRHLPFDNRVCDKSDNDFDESFRFVLPGYNLRPLEMSGALGLEQLKKLDKLIDGRRKNAAAFKMAFSDIEGVRVQKEVGSSSWFGFSIVLEKYPDLREGLISSLVDRGVDCRPIVAGNFANNSVVDYFDSTIHGSLVNADEVDRCGFFIGNHHHDVSDELFQIAEFIKAFLKDRGAKC